MFHLTIVTAEQTIYEGDIQMLVAPAVDGEIGILTNHHPLVTKLGPGGIRVVKTDGNEELLFTSGGYLEVSNNKATMLADIVENLEALQVTEAREARQRAEKMFQHTQDDVEREKLEKEIQLHMVRERMVNVAEMQKKK